MELDRLRRALDAALAALTPRVSATTPVELFLPVLPGGPGPLPEVAEVIAAVEDVPELRHCANSALLLPGAIGSSGMALFVQWIVRKCFHESSDLAIRAVEQYVLAQNFTARHVLAIAGLELSRPCQIDQETHLLPFQTVPETPQKNTVLWQAIQRMVFPTAALVRDLDVPKVLADPHNMPTNPFPAARNDSNDILLCAGLYGPTGPYFAASWWEMPDWIPTFGSSYAFTNAAFIPASSKWPEEAYEEFPELYRAFLRLKSAERDHLRVPLERLNASMHPTSLANGAIDCRVALESIFLSDQQRDHGEMSFRVSLRASRFLAQSYSERATVFKLIKDMYSQGSTAVHTGRVGGETAGHAPDGVLPAGRSAVALSLKRLIMNGIPKWQEVDLG
jgi:hypothetical protein